MLPFSMRAALLLLTLATSVSAQGLAPRPARALLTGRFQEPDLRESSGVVRSTRPRVLFTINDSGNPPEIFATDSSGRPLGRWRVPGVGNRDWEALSTGPCPSGTCFYIGDIGDNLERRPQVVLYRVGIPGFEVFRGGIDPAPLNLDSAVVRYPDGPHDAEAMWVGDGGGMYVVSKGRSGGVKLYRLPASAFGGGQPVTAVLVQTVPIQPAPILGRLVTDAARSPDGRRVVIRTYSELYFFALLGDGRLAPPATVCNVAGLEPQGEGVAWLDEHRLLLTSEAPSATGAGPIHIVTCGE
jgi:hypothetical protein